jgi:F-type H+-transporting ATPase subunit delta
MIAERYAKAIFSLAKEEGDCRGTGKELHRFLKLFEEVKELKIFLLNPAYSLKDKRKAIDGLDHVKDLTVLTKNFLLLLIKKGRLVVFSEICKFYDSFLDKEDGRLRAEVSLAVKSDDVLLEEIKKKLEKITEQEVVLSVKIDPNLIGGALVRSGDLIFDGSVKTQLETIKERLKEGVV